METTINTDQVLFQFFDKSDVESNIGVTFTDEQWSQFLEETQEDFGYYTTMWLTSRWSEVSNDYN